MFALANITFSYARYADALALYDRILASPAATGLEPQVKLGRAKSLSYLKRHDEAIALLIDLLQNDPSNNPGEKYYWRAWNRLQLGQAQLAYNDATAGLNAMRNDAIYRLAGMASFSLNRLGESRKFFEEALNDESRRLRLGALSRPAGFRGAQLEAGIGPVFDGGVVLRRCDRRACRASSPSTRRTSRDCRTGSSPPNASRYAKRKRCATSRS